ncbi:MAG TPA: serine hydrolase domain-containing protein [Pyrinomonadaceae bacterium]|jgi:CubicO group peptidase (beta-lactamase class C family)
MKIKILSPFLLVLALFTAGYAQTFDKAKLDKFFDALGEKNKAMGSLTVSKDGNVLYSRVVGYSQISGNEKKPASTATRYRIGSITKMFTAVMIFQLVEEGKLKLTDTLDKFFPQIPNAKKITIGNILNHRSGIHSFTGDADFRTWLMKPKTQSEILAIIAKSTPDFEPGAKESYSNAGYVLLGYIVEKVAKKSYQDALKERITSKIGLSDTYLGAGKTNTNNNESFSYNYAGNWKPETETDLSIPGGAGAIISTPTDLTKFIYALFNLKLVSQESLNQMKTNSMGMFPFPLDGKTLYGHTGGIDGFNSMLVYSPEEKLAVAYTSNGMVYPINDILLGAFAVYYNKPFSIPTFETVAVGPDILEKYVGVYSSAGFPLKITVTRDAATLYAQATGQSSFPLEATAQDKFKFDTAGVVIEFNAGKNQMTLRQGGREFIFTKEK